MELRDGEVIIKEQDANHFVSIEAVGGKLFLTNQRLYFKSHILNIQGHELTMELGDIENVEKRNTLLIVPNGISVKLKGGKEENFVVMGRDSWIEEISKTKGL